MTQKNDKYAPPEPGPADKAHALARAGLAAVPLVGGSAVELFSMLIMPPLQRRQADWMGRIADGLRQLEAGNRIDLDELTENDLFVDILMKASSMAVKNSQKEKIDALRNAVLNTAAGISVDESLQHLFLDLIDSFTQLHMLMLSFFENPLLWSEKHNKPFGPLYMGGPAQLVESSFPELRGKREIYDQIWKDMYLRGLVNIDGLHITMSGNGMVQKRTTPLGDSFLKYIKSPLDTGQ